MFDEVEPASTGTSTAPAMHAKSSNFSFALSEAPSPVDPAMTSPSEPSRTSSSATSMATSKLMEPSALNGVTMAVRTRPKRGVVIL